MITFRVERPVRGLPAVLWRSRSQAAYAASVVLHMGYVVLPLWMGTDKFAKMPNANWSGYLASTSASTASRWVTSCCSSEPLAPALLATTDDRGSTRATTGTPGRD